MQKLTDLTKEELIELIMREREVLSGWQPIESAPENKWVLMASSNGVVVDIIQKVREDGEVRFYKESPLICDRYYRDGTFTHWQPLPALPMEV